MNYTDITFFSVHLQNQPFLYMQISFDDAFFELEDYQITGETIGKGAYGEVYKVRNLSDKKIYAAKISSPSKEMRQGKNQKLFMRESMLMKMMKHPAIVGFYGMSFNSFNDPELYQPTIIMEYLKNGSLEKILESESKGLSNHDWTLQEIYLFTWYLSCNELSPSTWHHA